MDIQYGQLENLSWLWLVAGLMLIALIATFRKHRALAQFATPNLLSTLLPPASRKRGWISTMLTLASLIGIVIGLIDIRWGKTWRDVPQKGIEVVFALDVSRSMLAQDLLPNRLERAKQDIKDLVNEMKGDRVGLVIFAGEARRKTPLTNHYEDFKQMLDEVGPHNLDRGGSDLGAAIDLAAKSFLEKTADHKAIVLITDGEDHESQPLEAAKKVHQEYGIRIFTIGLGDASQGALIPLATRERGESFLEHQGEPVRSKLNGQILQQIATLTDGAFIPAGTKQVDMAAVYQRFIAGIDQRDFETARVNVYTPRYQWFLGGALACLVIEVLISTCPRPNQRNLRELTAIRVASDSRKVA